MTITFVSNYINHHQIPFCEAMRNALGSDFVFLQTEEIEPERLTMGWKDEADDFPWVIRLSEDPGMAQKLIEESDVVLEGWAPSAKSMIRRRLDAGKITFYISERIYKEGQWKAVSPRGLVSKYRTFTKYRSRPYYLLCAGAYVASDFQLIRAFPDRKLRWGYFPPTRTYARTQLERIKKEAAKPGVTRLMWAGRFVEFKHPEMVLRLAKDLKACGEKFELHVAGGGEGEARYAAFVQENRLTDCVVFHGFQTPEAVRGLMEQSGIFIFTSDRGEGWGAVVNEAMNSGCAVIAGSEAGAVPSLLQNGVNGMIYNRMNYEELLAGTRQLLRSPQMTARLGDAAVHTITQNWNAQTAAKRLLALCSQLTGGKTLREIDLPGSGPLSADPGLRPYLKIPE